MKKLFALLLILSFIACTDFDQEQAAGTLQKDYPDQESWDARMFFTKEGVRKAILTAGYIGKYSQKKYTLLKEGVRVDFYDEKGNPKSVLTSLEGKVFDSNQDMLATGEVVVVSKNGSTLYTDELMWNNKDEQIVSSVAVKITTETDTLFGDSFRSDTDLTQYEITNARGTSGKTISIDE